MRQRQEIVVASFFDTCITHGKTSAETAAGTSPPRQIPICIPVGSDLKRAGRYLCVTLARSTASV